MARKLIVEIIGDSSSVEKMFARASKSAKKFNDDVSKASRGTVAGSGAFKSLGRSVAFASGTFLGAAGLTAGIKSSVSAASDLNEQVSKTNVVFGKSAAGIQVWSKTTADAFGLSRRQALATASSFGALFAPIGIIGKTAAEQSKKLTELGADLASFYNTDVQDALDAIQSGLVGESEPLRRYGVLLSETRVQQQAMADTGKKNAKQLTSQEKALARIKIIFKDTKTAQGDFARTSGDLANKTKKLKANIDDLKTSLGQGLVPALTDASDALNFLLDDLRGMKRDDALVIGGPGTFEQNRKIIEQFLSIKDVLKLQKELARAGRGLTGPVGKPAKPFVPPGLQGPTKADVETVKRSAAQLNEWFDAMVGRRLDRAADLPLKQQLAALVRIGKVISARIKVTKDITRKLTLEDQLRQVVAGQKDVKRQLAQEFLEGLQFNVDKAGLTATMADDIAALNTLLAAIRKRMQLEGATLDLRQQELGVQQQLAAIAAQQAEQAKAARDAAQAAREQRAQTKVEWAQLALEKAQTTKGLGDDIKALKRIIALIRQQIRLTGLTVDLARQLFELQQQLKDVRSQARKKKKRGGGGDPFAVHGGFDRMLQGGSAFTPRPPRPTPSSGFGAGNVVINGGVNLYGVQDVSEMEAQIQKRAMARPQTRRGPV